MATSTLCRCFLTPTARAVTAVAAADLVDRLLIEEALVIVASMVRIEALLSSAAQTHPFWFRLQPPVGSD